MQNQSLVPGGGDQPVQAPINRYDESHINNTLQDIIQLIFQYCEDVENDNDEAEIKLINIAHDLQVVSDFYDGSLTFCRLGGLKSIEVALKHPSSAVRTAYLEVVGWVSQNNEEVQNHIYQHSELLENIVEMISKQNLPSRYRTKMLFALSALVRGNNEGKTKFFDVLNGTQILRTVFDIAFAEDDTRAGSRCAIVSFHCFKDNSDEPTREPALRELVTYIRSQMISKEAKYTEAIEYTSDL